MNLHLILIIVAIVLWFLSAIEWPKTAVQLGWLGMVAFGISLIIAK